MNDSQLRAAFPLPETPSTLDEKVDRALARHVSVRRIERRVALGFALTATLAVAFVAGPAVRAQASIARIVHALDKQTRVRVTTYSVDEQGRRWINATTTIANGDLAYIDAKGTRQHFDVGSKSYDLDPTIGRFVVSARRPGGSIRLSDMLSGASGFSLGKRADVQRVDGVLRATILNNGLPERYVIDADPRTELPLRMHVDALERGEWRTGTVLEFDYGTPVVALSPDLRRYPPTTREAADAAFESALTRNTIAELPLKRGRLVVRKLDVAQDGTVFVAYQSANDTARNTWNGYALDLADDLGTRYVRVGDMTDGSDSSSKGGLLQLETFAPVVPIALNRPRTLRIATHLWSDGRLARTNTVGSRRPDGHTDWYEQLNPWSRRDVGGREVAVMTQRVSAPTCGAMPSWSARLGMLWGNEPWAELAKAEARARLAIQERRWANAEADIDRELAMMDEGEKQGYGPSSRTRALDNLDLVRSASQGERTPEPKERATLSSTEGFDANGRRR